MNLFLNFTRPILLLFTLSLFSTQLFEALAADTIDENAKVDEITTEYMKSYKSIDLFWTTYYGGDLSQFGDYPSVAYYDRWEKLVESTRSKLSGINRDLLDRPHQISFDLLKGDLESSHESLKFDTPPLNFTQLNNRLKTYIADASPDQGSFPFETVEHYEAFIKRSEGFPVYIENQIQVLDRGVRSGLVLPCALIEKTRTTFSSALEPDVEKNPFYSPVTRFPNGVNEVDRERLKKMFHLMVQKTILPAMQKFTQYYDQSYAPHCRSSFGYGDLPDGKKLYRQMIQSNTDSLGDAALLHQKGLEEVARIRTSLEQVQVELGITGTFKDFLEKMKTDSTMSFTESDEVVHAFEEARARILAKVDTMFSAKPRSDFEIIFNPEGLGGPLGSYSGPNANVSHGRFFINVSDPKMVKRYTITTLMMHETIPGHHFQLALQFEMQDSLTEFQRTGFSSTAFIEGWALYAESLGYELGLYNDPVQKFGNLSDEMLRAVRLVVDTGIHEYGWSREQVLSFMAQNLAQDPRYLENEADRYAANPGQALAYKVGQLKIKELRTLAESELGSRFDLKEFHRIVLGTGTISLGVLENLVKEWIQAQEGVQ